MSGVKVGVDLLHAGGVNRYAAMFPMHGASGADQLKCVGGS
jgi:hypothetical protein